MIVLSVEADARGPVVTVVPITHATPSRPEHAVEIPSAVKRQLRLDDQRSWIVVSEGNEFLWRAMIFGRSPVRTTTVMAFFRLVSSIALSRRSSRAAVPAWAN